MRKLFEPPCHFAQPITITITLFLNTPLHSVFPFSKKGPRDFPGTFCFRKVWAMFFIIINDKKYNISQHYMSKWRNFWDVRTRRTQNYLSIITNSNRSGPRFIVERMRMPLLQLNKLLRKDRHGCNISAGKFYAEMKTDWMVDEFGSLSCFIY